MRYQFLVLLGLAVLWTGCTTAQRPAPPKVSADERLVYALTYNRQGEPSFMSTEIWTRSGEDSRRVFSDAELPIATKPIQGVVQIAIIGHDAILVPAVERKPVQGAWSDTAKSLYEVSVDGSNRYRKLLDLRGEQRIDKIFTDPAKARVAYVDEFATYHLFIHDMTSGSLLREIDLTKTILYHSLGSIGWLRDGKTLFFTLEPGIGDVTQDDYPLVGSWLVQEDLSGLRKISPPLGFIEDHGFDFPLDWRLPPILLTDTPDGNYLFRLARFRRPCPSPCNAESALVLSNPNTQLQKVISLPVPFGIFWLTPSASGKSVAFTQEDPVRLSGTTPVPRVQHLLIQLLETGEVKEVWSKPDAQLVQPPFLTVIGWF